MEDEILELFDDQKTIRYRFISQIAKENNKIAGYLRKIFHISTNPDRQKRIDIYQKTLNELPFGSLEREKLIEYYAKIMDLERRIRKFVNAKIYNEKIENPNSTATADRFDYVFTRMREENVEPEIVAKFFNENAFAIFSLTMHPTNPTSMEYTIQGVIQDLPLTGRKKTIEEEVNETLAILDMIYYTTSKLRKQLIKTLEDFPEYKKVIDVNIPKIQASIWSADDGDGNENADIKALERAIQQLKQRIKELYLIDLKEISSREIDLIEQKLKSNSYKISEEFINDLISLKNTEEFIYKIRTFGFYYTQIDIRHNSIDIMNTLTYLLKMNHLHEDFLSLSLKEQKDFINKCLNNEQIIEKLKLTNQDELIKLNKTAGRIFGRLKLIPNDLDIFNKLIIGETKSIVNVLAVFLLLKASGNCVAEKETVLDIVTLSESVRDLQELPHLIAELIDHPIYRKHLSFRGKIIVMLGKNHTVRKNGRGAESFQEEALGKVYAMIDHIRSKYSELKHLTINGFSGGGAALQRVGGRVTEIPHNNGRIARYFHAKTLGPSLLTIQGHQMQILFSPTSICLHTLESLVAQNLHARVQTELKADGTHYVPPRHAPEGYDQNYHIGNFHKACQVMRETYFNFMGDLDDDDNDIESGNNSFNQLFANAPWVSVILGNLSSHPSKHANRNLNFDQITLRNIRGENPKLLTNTANTVERLKSIPYDELHAMYLCGKSARDFMRNTALSLHMTDFDLAWKTMIGEIRPNRDELKKLADQFDRKCDVNNSNKSTLAWLEFYAYDVAKLVQKCILNQGPSEDFNLTTPLKNSFPNLAQQLTIREESDEFGRYAEADMTNFINHNLDYVLTEREIATIQSCYAAADIVNAPEGGLNIELTRHKH
ncbi:hypothetical protein I4U23_027244 [Adineta vaga]|nr:hypothetical protein I4U23_027244 [Adineta vaga]